jgi:hypothetical protein
VKRHVLPVLLLLNHVYPETRTKERSPSLSNMSMHSNEKSPRWNRPFQESNCISQRTKFSPWASQRRRICLKKSLWHWRRSPSPMCRTNQDSSDLNPKAIFLITARPASIVLGEIELSERAEKYLTCRHKLLAPIVRTRPKTRQYTRRYGSFSNGSIPTSCLCTGRLFYWIFSPMPLTESTAVLRSCIVCAPLDPGCPPKPPSRQLRPHIGKRHIGHFFPVDYHHHPLPIFRLYYVSHSLS